MLPEVREYTVSKESNALVYALQPIDSLDISGVVKGEDGRLISGAVVSVSQLLNGKYSRSVIGKTDKNGKYRLNVYNDASTITFSANGYINQTLSRTSMPAGTWKPCNCLSFQEQRSLSALRILPVSRREKRLKSRRDIQTIRM